jgi:hypothetical protein
VATVLREETYAFDAVGNRTDAVKEPGSDGLGRRVRKTSNGVTTRYLHDGDHRLMELDGAGQPVREYSYCPGIDNPPAVRRSPRKQHRLPVRGRRLQYPGAWRTGSGQALHVGGVKSLGARLDLELHLLTLGERLEALHADRGEVDEHVLAPLLLDEAVPLGVIEPLHFPSGHCLLPPTK